MKSHKRIIGVDVDLTVCPSADGWLAYLNNVSGRNVILDGGKQYPYNLSMMFPEVEDPYKYWRDLDYSCLEPISGSVNALYELSEYFDIVFISQHKGTHSKSKYYWLDKHFPFKKGVILTKEKYLMNDSVVVMIDDRASHLQYFEYYKRVLFKTQFEQEVEMECPITLNGWNNATAILLDYLMGDV